MFVSFRSDTVVCVRATRPNPRVSHDVRFLLDRPVESLLSSARGCRASLRGLGIASSYRLESIFMHAVVWNNENVLNIFNSVCKLFLKHIQMKLCFLYISIGSFRPYHVHNKAFLSSL